MSKALEQFYLEFEKASNDDFIRTKIIHALVVTIIKKLPAKSIGSVRVGKDFTTLIHLDKFTISVDGSAVCLNGLFFEMRRYGLYNGKLTPSDLKELISLCKK